MLWYLPWSENIKKRACRYLLQRYLGNFLEEKLTLDQLSVDLYNGTGTVSEVSLDCEALNEVGDSQNWPLEIVDGYMTEITVTIPWSTILKDDSVVEVKGLCLTVQPKERAEPVSSMLESMWSSMSSSMQLAEECLKQEDGPPEAHPVEGIEMFAHAIDSILSRVKIRFVDTKIRIEHVPKNSERGIALEIHIKHIDYFDEAGTEPTPDVTDPEAAKTYIVATYTNKRVAFEGVELHTDEYPSRLRTVARRLAMDRSTSTPDRTPDCNVDSTLTDVFYETRSVISDAENEPPRAERREATPEERASQCEPILFARLTDRQELVLKLKNTAEAMGPKIEMQMTLGALIVFLTPRQLHTLLELVDGINQPHLEDNSNMPLRLGGRCKPMAAADFQLVEAQLLGALQPPRRAPPPVWTGWSANDESVADERFQPMTSRGGVSDSFASTASSMSASAASSVHLPAAGVRAKRNKKVPLIDGDPTAEVSHINVRMSSCSCLLLHKDILLPCPLNSGCAAPSSAKKMQEAANDFFDKLGNFSVNGNGKKDFDAANKALDAAVDKSHIRLIATALSMEGSEKRTAHGSQAAGELAADTALLRECLRGAAPQAHDLLAFQWKEEEEDLSDSMSTVTVNPNIRVNFKQTLKYMRFSGENKLVFPTTEISVKLMPLFVDVDLTLLERVAASLGREGGPAAPAAPPAPAQRQLNLSVQCTRLDAAVRFPIVDLRSTAERGARRVRGDHLRLELQDALANMQLAPSERPPPTALALRCTTVDLYYLESESSAPTHVARAGMSDGYDPTALGAHATALPTVTITFKPRRPGAGLYEPPPTFHPAADPMTASVHMLEGMRQAGPGPFSCKKTAHQSFSKGEGSKEDVPEELVVPGSAEEMREFTEGAVEKALIHLDLNLPVLSLQLESKQLYEVIYNRINNDLLLWEPRDDAAPPADLPDIYPAFAVCKTGGYDSDSESSSSEEENIYFSTYDGKVRARRPPPPERDDNNFCLTLKLAKGLLTMYTPVRDSNKRVVPGQAGELAVEAARLALCVASGVRGRPKTAQLCLRAHRAVLYHDPLLTMPSPKPPLRLHGAPMPPHARRTVYPSAREGAARSRPGGDMLALALNAEPVADMPNYKKVCIALGIEQGTLRHRGERGAAWLTQLLDVLDVADYPVPGYRPGVVLSELHVHLWDVAVDYRPIHLPLRTVLSVGTFSVANNVIPETNTSTLRILAQDCALFLSRAAASAPAAPAPAPAPAAPRADAWGDYVCVADVGLFELTLRMSDKSDPNTPHVELTASNNVVTLRTCWDSASALCRLITYVAGGGDAGDAAPLARHRSEPSLVGLDDTQDEVREWSPSEIQQVNNLMAEAMKESPNSTLDEDEIISSTEGKEGVEIFFFPDESNKTQLPKPRSVSMDPQDIDKEDATIEFEDCQSLEAPVENVKPENAQVAMELGDPSAAPKVTPKKSKRDKKPAPSDPGTDDEYCMVEGGRGEDDDAAEPTVAWYGGAPPMIDDHFAVPVAKSDVLNAPKSFPVPSLKYTLGEMSVVWQIFGGNDFAAEEKTPPKKNVHYKDSDSRNSSPKTTKRSTAYEPYETRAAPSTPPPAARAPAGPQPRAPPGHQPRAQPREQPREQPRGWRTRGGAQRDHRTSVIISLNKIKFQHETYPGGGVHASRQTLAVSRVEVLDRLADSRINKLLSQHSALDEPERKNAHMLIIKAVHLRPDPALSAQECCLKVSLLPLRFIIDQDTLAFLMGFFSKLGSDEPSDEEPKTSSASDSSRQSTPTRRAPVMSVGAALRDPPPTPTSLVDADALSLNDTCITNEGPFLEPYEAERLVSENLIQLEEDFKRLGAGAAESAAGAAAGGAARGAAGAASRAPDLEPQGDAPIYFRRVVFSPDVSIRLDYVGKRVDLSAGPVAGLLMGLGQLNCSELRLKRLCYRHGLLGLEKLVRWALQEWLADIKRHQLPGLLGGIGPMHSLLQFITGIRDLVWLPVEQWRRDGRLVHGLRRGAASFSARTAVAALDVTQRVLRVIQATCETAFDMVSPAPALPAQPARRRRRERARHPADLREGVASAYLTMREGLVETADTLRRAEGAELLRRLPGAAVAPLALCAAGAADVLGGVRASLAPADTRRHADKWRRPDGSD